jgi:hypothetical protein
MDARLDWSIKRRDFLEARRNRTGMLMIVDVKGDLIVLIGSVVCTGQYHARVKAAGRN